MTPQAISALLPWLFALAAFFKVAGVLFAAGLALPALGPGKRHQELGLRYLKNSKIRFISIPIEQSLSYNWPNGPILLELIPYY
jgi:hypothetical protein